jgi:hypothetical protein
MPVKHWTFAGLMVTSWCPARCASCYLCCGPERREHMPMALALSAWEGLVSASPHGCRIHVSGGEPFGDWPRLAELLRRAAAARLGPLDRLETNGFWAADRGTARRRLRLLDAVGLGRLVISCDPYHQQFVPIGRVRLLAEEAEAVLGPDRVQVRWRDWLAEGFATDGLDGGRRRRLFAAYAARGRDRLNGRAAAALAPLLTAKPAAGFADINCRRALLRSRHVHVAPAGELIPGVCAGISLGTLAEGSVADLWRQLDLDHAQRGIVGALSARGPVGLLAEAERHGYRPEGGYASKCHLCWSVRAFLHARGLHARELGPRWLYEAAAGESAGERGGTAPAGES